MSELDQVIEYLKDYSTPATITDNGESVNGRVVNLATLPKNIGELMTKFLGEFNPNKLQLMFITDSGRFIFAKDVELKVDINSASDGVVDFSFATKPIQQDPRKIY